MKTMRFCAALIVSVLIAGGIHLAAQPAAAPAASGPIIQVDVPIFDFGKASSGDKVHHTYIVSNTGTEMLIISNVHPGCGCTTAGTWSHDIAPGKTGEIPVQFNSANYASRVTKTIDVYSNAKNEPHKVLQLTGLVWKPINVVPPNAFINIPLDSTNDVSTKVQLMNQTDDPVIFSNAVCSSPHFTAEVKEVKAGKIYELLITAHPPFNPGNTPGTVTVNTSLAGTPTISVTTMANVKPAVQVSPSQIYLNPLANRWTTNRVTIYGEPTIANTTNLLTVSNPKANDSRIQLDLKPGFRKGTFTLMVAFPPDFQVAPGQHAEITIESNHPRYPLVRIPIMQFYHPKTAAMQPHPLPPPVANHP